MKTITFDDGKTYQLTEVELSKCCNSKLVISGAKFFKSCSKCWQAYEIETTQPPKKPESVNTSKTIWDLEVGDEFWVISDQCDRVFCTVYDLNIRRNSGNCFLTKPEAEKELQKRQAIQKIKKYIHDEGMDNGWRDDGDNWYPYWDLDYKKFVSYQSLTTKSYSPIGYLPYESHNKKIIDNFSSELKLIFDV